MYSTTPDDPNQNSIASPSDRADRLMARHLGLLPTGGVASIRERVAASVTEITVTTTPEEGTFREEIRAAIESGNVSGGLKSMFAEHAASDAHRKEGWSGSRGKIFFRAATMEIPAANAANQTLLLSELGRMDISGEAVFGHEENPLAKARLALDRLAAKAATSQNPTEVWRWRRMLEAFIKDYLEPLAEALKAEAGSNVLTFKRRA